MDPLSPHQAEFGNHAVDVVKKAVRENGWEASMAMSLPQITNDIARFIRHVPGCGEPGTEMKLDLQMTADFQVMMSACAVLVALSAEDARRVDNGAQVRRVAELALHRGPSVDFAGYYQRHIKAA